MNRDTARLAGSEYELVIVGGGIYGVCAAWDAALRGLSVALVERGDFGHATSANCLKIAHGGLRYIQQADFRHMRESTHELKVLMHIAPQLVHRIPFLIPTYGHGMRGKGILRLGLLIYDLITFDRNRGAKDLEKRIPRGGVLARSECLRLFPGLEKKGLTGGVFFYDGQMYNPPRLVLSFLKSAVEAGSQACNYVEVTGFLRGQGRVTGVKVREVLTGNEFEIRGKVVLNASGPWAEQILSQLDGRQLHPPLLQSKSLYLVVDRPLAQHYALAVPSKHRDPNAVVSRGPRHLFIIPWRNKTLIGSSHLVYKDSPDEFAVTAREIQDLIDEINECYPPAALTRREVSFCNAGLVPMQDNGAGSADVRLAKRYRIIDHEAVDGLAGLITVVGVRFTTARIVAEKTIDLVFRKLGYKPPKATTVVSRLYGGQLERFDDFLAKECEKHPYGLNRGVMSQLVRNYGSAYAEVLQRIDGNPQLRETIADSNVIKAEVLHAVRTEMAQRLGDVVLRRTDLGTAGNPGEAALGECAALMARELKWGQTRVEKELDEVRAVFP